MPAIDLSEFAKKLPIHLTGIQDKEGNEVRWTIPPFMADVELAVRELESNATAQQMTMSQRYAAIVALLVSDPPLDKEWLVANFDGPTLQEVARRVFQFFLYGSLPPVSPESPQPETT